MIHSRSLEIRRAFYVDPEISSVSDSSEQLAQVDSICTYPSPDYGAYATSLPKELSDSNFSFGSFEATPPEPRSLLDLVQAGKSVNSPQVMAFWRLYQAYPKHLKAIEKRKKRKTKRQLSSTGESPGT
jgi:hypothetical protein